MILPFLRSSFDIWLFEPSFLINIKNLNIIKAKSHFNWRYIGACSSKYVKFIPILNHRMSESSVRRPKIWSYHSPFLLLHIKDSNILKYISWKTSKNVKVIIYHACCWSFPWIWDRPLLLHNRPHPIDYFLLW